MNNIKLSSIKFDAIIRSVYADIDGGIKYKEFIKKLIIYGVQCVAEEQQILNMIYENMKKLGYSLQEVFQIFYKDGKIG